MQLILFCLALSYILTADDINRGIARQSIDGEVLYKAIVAKR